MFIKISMYDDNTKPPKVIGSYLKEIEISPIELYNLLKMPSGDLYIKI